jgi:hypothetical protein
MTLPVESTILPFWSIVVPDEGIAEEVGGGLLVVEEAGGFNGGGVFVGGVGVDGGLSPVKCSVTCVIVMRKASISITPIV